MEPLKLIALDADDLDVVSAFCQDAVLKVGDIRWLQAERRLVLTMNRFAWETVEDSGKKTFERRRAALHFDRVTRVQSAGIPRSDADQVLSLLTLQFEGAEETAPQGTVTLAFAGGGTLRLDVECLEAQLADLGGAWSTQFKPSHRTGDEA